MNHQADDSVRIAGKKFSADRTQLLAGEWATKLFPYSALDASLWEYYESATATTPVDLSCLEFNPASVAPRGSLVAAQAGQEIGFFGRSATFELARDVAVESIPSIGASIAETLRDRCRSGEGDLRVQVIGAGTVMSGFETVLLGAGAEPTLAFSAEVDLRLREEELWRHLRRRFRPFVNAGRRELRTEIVNEQNPSQESFETYRALHLEAAGRETRPRASWDAMYELLRKGRGQLVLAYLEERPVAATYTMRFGSLAIYASGAYARDLGKYPVSHWPLYASMLEAKRVGVERFVLGQVFLETSPNTTPKERTIGDFKRGFATEVVAKREYLLRTNELS